MNTNYLRTGYTESQHQTDNRAWHIALQSLGYDEHANTEAEADTLHKLLAPSPVLFPEPTLQRTIKTTDMPTSLKQQRTRILAAFEQEPPNKEEADELFHKLLEIDDHLQPEYAEARRVADNFNFDNVEPIQF